MVLTSIGVLSIATGANIGLEEGKYLAFRIESQGGSSSRVMIFHHHLMIRHLFITRVLMMPSPPRLLS